MHDLFLNFPDANQEALKERLAAIAVDERYPRLRGYSHEAVHRDLAGQGGLFLAADMAELLALRPGWVVLDLACGWGETSVFLAEQFGVEVVAVDADRTLPDQLAPKLSARGLGGRVRAVVADARRLPFEPDAFDAIFVMNSLFYFGTNPGYPRYLASFLRPGGRVAVGGPCYKRELTPDVPKEFLLEYPACLDVHSPGWWKAFFEESGCYEHVASQEHRDGVRFWPDRIHRLLAEQPITRMSPGRIAMIRDILRMLAKDKDGFVTHFILSAARRFGSDV